MIRRQLNMKPLAYRIWSCQLKPDYRIVELAEALLDIVKSTISTVLDRVRVTGMLCNTRVLYLRRSIGKKAKLRASWVSEHPEQEVLGMRKSSCRFT